MVLRHDIRIKLPEAVPENVANSFTALIPASVIVTGAMLIFILLDKVFNTTFFDFIYEVLQSPLQGVTDSLGGALLLGFVIPSFGFRCSRVNNRWRYHGPYFTSKLFRKYRNFEIRKRLNTG